MGSESLKASELERFERNLESFARLDPGEAMYHRYQGILESQIVTLQCCGVISAQRAVLLGQKVAEVVATARRGEGGQS